MGENSSIEWTDHTWNPVSGCTKVSPGCANCYAEKLSSRFPHLGSWGPGAERKRTSAANWRKPLAWARAARAAVYPCHLCGKQATCFGVYEDPQGQAPRPACDGCCGHGCEDGWCKPIAELRPRVFCASLADWLDPEWPAEVLADMLALIAQTPELDWLLLTKRPQLWQERVTVAMAGCFDEDPLTLMESWLGGDPPSNVWIGTSVEDQARAEERIPRLLEIPARVRFLSCEPLLGLVDLGLDDPIRYVQAGGLPPPDPIVHWVIAGGESGPGARPMHPAWARSLRDQCVEAGVAFHFKQWGAWEPGGTLPRRPNRSVICLHAAGMTAWTPDNDHNPIAAGHPGWRIMTRVGKKAAGRELDGRTWDEVPRG